MEKENSVTVEIQVQKEVPRRSSQELMRICQKLLESVRHTNAMDIHLNDKSHHDHTVYCKCSIAIVQGTIHAICWFSRRWIVQGKSVLISLDRSLPLVEMLISNKPREANKSIWISITGSKINQCIIECSWEGPCSVQLMGGICQLSRWTLDNVIKICTWWTFIIVHCHCGIANTSLYGGWDSQQITFWTELCEGWKTKEKKEHGEAKDVSSF